MILCIGAGILSSCNTTKFLGKDEQLLQKNEVVILEPDAEEQSEGLIYRSLSGFIRNTEDKEGFEWVYENIDRRVNAPFWLSLRNPRVNAENQFIQEKLKDGSFYFLNPDEKSELRYDLGNHVLQRPNNNRFLVWLHQKIDDDTDSKFWKSMQSKIAREPVLVDSVKIEKSRSSMKNYLYGKGYFDAEVDYFINTKNKKSIVRYYPYGLKAYRIKSYKVISEDTTILSKINQNIQQSHLKPGDVLTLENYDLERNRISRDLRNAGYFGFTPSYISELQAGDKDDSLDLNLIVYRPSDTSYFQTYRNGDIHIYLDVNADEPDSNYTTVDHNGISYSYKGEEPPIKFNTLSQRVKIKNNQLYRQEDLDNTKKQLNVLGLYKFVYVNPINSAENIGIIDYNVYLNSLKKITLGYDFDINTASNSSTNQGPLLGSTIRGNYRNRNLFRGAEIWDSFIELGLEYTLRNQGGSFNPISTFNLRFQNNITLPGLKDWNSTLGLYKRLLSDEKRNELEKNTEAAKSQITFGYDYKSIVTFYRYNLFSLGLNYEFNNPKNHWNTRVNPVGLYYFDPQTEPTFDSLIINNQVFTESFTTQLFTAVLLNELDLTYKSPVNNFDESYTFRFFFETSGLEIMGAEALINGIRNRSDTIRLNNELDFARFIKMTLEWSYLRQLNSDRSVGLRMKTGVISSFGQTSPYVKALFAGGAFSVRSWAERDLGPGSYIAPPVAGSNVQIPFQVGDFLLEMMSEFRFPLFAYLKGAVFLDAGNIWSLNPNDSREGAYISSDWYKEIGIGSGFGLRLDISYAVIRLDIGQKIRLPYTNPTTGNQWAIKTMRDIGLSGFNYNLALGYPF